MKATDWPILSGVVEGIKLYVRTTRQIATMRGAFFDRQLLNDRGAFGKSMRYFEVAVGAALVYLVPFFVLHGQSISNFVFVLQQIFTLVLAGWLFHRVARLLKWFDTTFEGTLTLLGYLFGFTLIIIYVISTPMLALFGPDIMFRAKPIENSVQPIVLVMIGLLQLLGVLFFLWVFMSLGLTWFSQSFLARRRQVLVVWLIAGLLATPVHLFFIAPVFALIETTLGAWLIPL